MSVEVLKEIIPEFAKDIRINLSRVLTAEGSPGLSPAQRSGIALACALSTRSPFLIEQITHETAAQLSAAEVQAAKTAVCLMAMNNVYYRGVGMVAGQNLLLSPSGLRMQGIRNHGISEVDFELYCLAVSAINGCHYCVDSHAKKVMEAGVPKEGVQSAIRIAAVIQAVEQAGALN